jgi:lipopolysaccharide/colanic/teichoic acid biosynthesis glycosyltransferase
MAVVALAIKLTSPGPVFYAARRVGLGQRRFRCYKFRTMQADAQALQAELEALNEADGAVFKIKDDPRVTPLGRWLRALSIDELPQLINVLRGEMSLVGPRPLPLRDNELLAAWHKQRHVVLPGMTGLWQVRGRSDTSFDEMIDLDLLYIDSWSLWLDFSIMLRTAGAVFGSHGAY